MTLAAFPEPSRKLIALRVLGMLPSDDLPDVAARLLDAAPSSSLAALAGATRADDPRERAGLFERGLDELNLELPSRLEAAAYLVRQLARESVSGELPTRAAAGTIRDVYQAVEADLPPQRFVGSALGIELILGLYDSFGDTLTAAEHDDIERALAHALDALAGPDPGR